MKKICNRTHWECIRNDKRSYEYCMKEETRLDGPWEFGTKPLVRSSKKDWEEIKEHAKSGNFEKIPADVYVQHYKSL